MILTKQINIEVYPTDAPELMTYVDAVKWVDTIGYGWRLPTLEELRLVYENKGNIKGLKTSKSYLDREYPEYYWSSTETRDHSSYVWTVRFSDGKEVWVLKDYFRLSCRPVRLVVAPGCAVESDQSFNHSDFLKRLEKLESEVFYGGK